MSLKKSLASVHSLCLEVYDRRRAEEHGVTPESPAYSPAIEDIAAEMMLESIEEMTTNVDAV